MDDANIAAKKKTLGTNLLLYLLFFKSVSYYLNVIMADGFGIEVSISWLLYGIGLAIGAFSYFYALSFKHVSSIFVLLFCAFGTAIFFLIHEEYSHYVFTSVTDLAYNSTIALFFYSLPVLFLCNSEKVDFSLLMKRGCVVSRFILVLFCVCYFVFNLGSHNNIEYMTFSYNALPAICFCLVFRSENQMLYIIDKTLVIFSLFVTFVGGARGALLCNLVFIIIVLLFSKSLSNNKRIIFVILSVVITVIMFFFWEEIIDLIVRALRGMGVSSRTVRRLSDASFIKSSDRTAIWDRLMSATYDSPLFGYGMWGDRVIVGQYAHNLYVEFFSQYGYLLGGIFSVAVTISIVYTMLTRKTIKNEDLFTLFLIAIPNGFIHLQFSSSYLIHQWFFLLIGLVLAISNQRSAEKSSNRLQKA